LKKLRICRCGIFFHMSAVCKKRPNVDQTGYRPSKLPKHDEERSKIIYLKRLKDHNLMRDIATRNDLLTNSGLLLSNQVQNLIADKKCDMIEKAYLSETEHVTTIINDNILGLKKTQATIENTMGNELKHT